jgi:hypothetical protein
MTNLDAALEAVSDELSFLAFARALVEDRRRNERSWENESIEQFLDSAVAWGEATNLGASQGLAEASPWKRVAVFLYCGKIYE